MTDDRMIWVAGHNDAGYSPDPESNGVFVDQESARLFVADEIDRLADFLYDGEQSTASDDYATAEEFEADTDRPSCGASADAENVKGNADGDYSGEFSIAVEDGRPLPTIYWVQAATIADVFGDDTESDQYLDIIEQLPDAGVNQILAYVREDDIKYDPFGTCLSALFAVCDGLTLFGVHVPEELQYRPSPMLLGSDPMEYLAAEYSSLGEIIGESLARGDTASVLYAARVLNRFDALCRLAGRDY